MSGAEAMGFWAFAAVGLAVAAFWLRRRHTKENAVLQEQLQSARRALRGAAERESLALQKLRIREESLDSLLNSTRDIALVFALTVDGKPDRFTHANDGACQALGYKREELLSKTPADIELFAEPGGSSAVGTENLTLVNREMLGSQSVFAARMLDMLIARLVVERQVIYEGRYVTQAGNVIPVEITACRFALGEEPAVVCMAHDITERQKRELAIQAKDKLLRDLVGKLAIGLAVFDGNKKLTSANPACLKMFGCPDDHELELFNLLDNAFMPEAVRESIRRGDSLQCELTVDFDEVMRQGLCVSSRRGKGHFDLVVTNLGLDEQFVPRGRLVQVLDTTAHRETEDALRLSEQHLRQAQKMEAIGTLAGGIAHDFNNVLTPILGYADMALDLCVGGSRLRDYIEEILAASRRARDLVAQILAFSRRDAGNHMPMHLAPIIKEVVKQRAAVLPPNIRIQHVIKETNDLARASPTQIHQVLTNLCRNAEHAMRDAGGVIEVRLTSFVLTSLYRREFPTLVTRDYVRQNLRKRYLRLTVRDTGCGMDPDTIKKIFDVFFTTKKEGEGTGMGLAVVRGHVASLGGAISVESAVGAGSSFHIAIPMLAQAEEEASGAAQTVAPVGRERILFVDDEVSVVRMAAHMLESLGYETVVTSQSGQALKIFKNEPGRFDVVITDQVMPEMTGVELAREILKIRPEIPIVLCTGFSEKVSEKDALGAGVRVYVTKPVERGEMATAIRRAVGSTLSSPADAAVEEMAPMGVSPTEFSAVES